MTIKPRSHVRSLISRTWAIDDDLHSFKTRIQRHLQVCLHWLVGKTSITSEFATSETRERLEPKFIPQLFLGLLLRVTCAGLLLAIFFPVPSNRPRCPCESLFCPVSFPLQEHLQELLQVSTFGTLRLRFFGISGELRTSRSHVTRALPSGLRFEVHFCTARPRSRGKWFTARVFAPLNTTIPRLRINKSFQNFFAYWLSNSISKKRNFEDNRWMNTNMAAASYHPRILSPKYG